MLTTTAKNAVLRDLPTDAELSAVAKETAERISTGEPLDAVVAQFARVKAQHDLRKLLEAAE